ncbi:MAG: flavodoxin family protein [Armatimonadetes bacterium]|nr:flavodoxin family protein [Armatimonadota bacterium]
MGADVIGISGSPVPHSNTDRVLQAVLESTGLSTEFVKLSEYRYEACRACLGCVKTNVCVIQDDAQQLIGAFRDAKAFVLGAFTPYSSLDARSKAFMERTYCLRHLQGLNRAKPGAAIITTACEPGAPNLPPAAEVAQNQLAFWMMEEGMRNLGSLVVRGNVPCIRCGFGDECELSGIRMLHGETATVDSVGVRTFEEDPVLVARAQQFGRMIRAAVVGEQP